MHITILVLFNLIFFWEVYRNPFVMATSELQSTFFPSWLWMGRQIRQKKSWKYDPYYWINFHGHSILGAYYLPNIITSWIGSWLSLNNAFKLKVYTIPAHFLAQSLFWYIILCQHFSISVALFGAITFTYCAWNIRNQPYIVYTLTWIPLIFCKIPIVAIIGMTMALTAGYYPYLLYFMPFAALLNPVSMIGAILALPQLIPFFKYMPRTVKWRKAAKMKCGPWEYQWYFGLTPILIAMCIPYILLCIAFVLLWILIKDYLPRVPERAFIVLTYILIYFSLCMVSYLAYSVILLQCFDLWHHNRKKIVYRPYTELQNKPSWAFNNKLTEFLKTHLNGARVSGLPYPLFTGHIHSFKTLGYCGGMANRMMAKFRNDKNPNGSGSHDWFKENEDSPKLDMYGVRYAFTSTKPNWKYTSISNLWENPRI